ncbi:MAG: FG-GAP-like repeat-containing protein [Flavobacteriaceae bacterium]
MPSLEGNGLSLIRSKGHFLRFRLKGSPKNPFGIGTKILLEDLKTGHLKTEQLSLTRGFQSSMEPIVHFGMGAAVGEQRLTVTWPDGKQEIKVINDFNRLLELDYSNAVVQKHLIRNTENNKFVNVTPVLQPNFRHKEDVYDDYRFEPLLPHKYSRLGPGLAVADVNKDGLDDFYVGNAKNALGKLYLQTAKGGFKEMKGPWAEDEKWEDTGAKFIDVDADGDQDLYVVSGGYQRDSTGISYQDRLYINSNGKFSKSKALPKMPISGQLVAACDYDKDGDQDLFIGGRVVPGKYPQIPQSYLLQNNGKNGDDLKFKDVAVKMAGLSETGMVTSAIWVDVDDDGWQDLIVAGEWMSLKLFKNNQGQLIEQTKEWGLKENIGWWYGLETLDVDNDGDMDLVAGNLGLNYKYRASAEKPFEIFLNDFDSNGKQDIVIGVHKEGKLLPLRGRECSSQQIPAIKAKYSTYREFAAADLSDIYGERMLENSIHYQATTFAHYWLENNGKGKFIWHLLPNRSQLSPINNIQVFDYDNDGYKDLLVIGALYNSEVETPRADAGMGLVLRNIEGRGFEAIPPSESGLLIKGNIKTAHAITIKGKEVFVFAKGNDSLEFIVFQKNKRKELSNNYSKQALNFKK